MDQTTYQLHPIGWVESPLTDRELAPKQADEGAPEAWLVFNQDMLPAMRELKVGEEMILLTWLDRADRTVLRVHSRGDLSRPECGVFSARSPDRPNPIGLHTVEIAAIDGTKVQVRHLEALDGTPILDLKPFLGPIPER